MIDEETGEITLETSVESDSLLTYRVNYIFIYLDTFFKLKTMLYSPLLCSLSLVLCFYQIRVEVYDNGSPPKKDICIVNVIVNRNLNSPRFVHGSQTVNILYTQELGMQIGVVEAEDEDRKVCLL